MKKAMLIALYAAGVFCFTSCKDEDKKETAVVATATEPAKPDLAAIRAEIVTVENEWAAAMNAKDTKALMALYADDAVSMVDGGPMLMGKAAIQKSQEEGFAKPPTYASIAFETMDVYAQGDVATEVGKTMYKDAAGKTTGAGKYIAVFQKKDGKYVCIREIYNKDSK